MAIEGATDITFTEDVAARFLAYGWNVATVADANDLGSVERALHDFRAETERPTLILVHSHIGYGSAVEDSPKAHGEPLGVDGVRATKEFLGLSPDRDSDVPPGVREHFASGLEDRGRRLARSARGVTLRRGRGPHSPACIGHGPAGHIRRPGSGPNPNATGFTPP